MGSNIHIIQNQIDSIGSGYFILIHLINYEELQTFYNNTYNIIDDLNQIVRKNIDKIQIKTCTHIEQNKILLVIPKISEDKLQHFIYDIYEASQLYTNSEDKAVYMQCKIATIDFSAESKEANDLYKLLSSLLSQDKSSSFFKKYNSKTHNIDTFKLSNTNLNVLRKAIQENTFSFAYQPIIDRNTGSAYYYECLLRMPDKNNHIVSVGPVISDAETKGLINVIDRVVFKKVVEELEQTPNITLSVNISNIGIISDYFIKFAKDLLAKHNVANRLIIEITETSINEDYHKTKLFIDALHVLGCKFALDDFGAGFTSFIQLQNLPIDIIKIDGSYVRNVLDNWYSQYFIETMVKISEELGIKTVAEFVENGEIAKFLIDLKVDCMQGNFFSPATSQRV